MLPARRRTCPMPYAPFSNIVQQACLVRPRGADGSYHLSTGSPASLLIASLRILSSSADFVACNRLNSLSFSIASACTTHTEKFVSRGSPRISPRWPCRPGSRGVGVIRTWLVALGVLLQLAHKVVELLLPLHPICEALLLQIGVVLLEQLLFCWRYVVRERRSAYDYCSAAVVRVSASSREAPGEKADERDEGETAAHPRNILASIPQFVGFFGMMTVGGLCVVRFGNRMDFQIGRYIQHRSAGSETCASRRSRCSHAFPALRKIGGN